MGFAACCWNGLDDRRHWRSCDGSLPVGQVVLYHAASSPVSHAWGVFENPQSDLCICLTIGCRLSAGAAPPDPLAASSGHYCCTDAARPPRGPGLEAAFGDAYRE